MQPSQIAISGGRLALPSEGEGHTFESCRVRHFGTDFIGCFLRSRAASPKYSCKAVAASTGARLPTILTGPTRAGIALHQARECLNTEVVRRLAALAMRTEEANIAIAVTVSHIEIACWRRASALSESPAASGRPCGHPPASTNCRN
jgi:hypothetical protein